MTVIMQDLCGNEAVVDARGEGSPRMEEEKEDRKLEKRKTKKQKSKALSHRLCDWLCAQEDDSFLLFMRMMIFGVVLHDVCDALFDKHWVFLGPRSEVVVQVFQNSWTPSYLYAQWLPKFNTAEAFLIIYAAMAVAACLVLVGYCYHLSMAVVAVIFSFLFFENELNYLNHQYLLVLICWSMLFLPAAQSLSVDAFLKGKGLGKRRAPRWMRAYFELVLSTVYLYGSWHKVNRDWLMGQPLNVWLRHPRRERYAYLWPLKYFNVMENVVRTWWLPYIIAYGGILWDGAAPFLLFFGDEFAWRPCSALAIAGSLCFHLTNHFFFNIGVFPWISLWMSVVLFPGVLLGFSKQWRSGRKKRRRRMNRGRRARRFGWREAFFLVAAAFVVLFPLRSLLYPGHVFWAQDGHMFSWRMMLRQRNTKAFIRIDTGAAGVINRYNATTDAMVEFERYDRVENGGTMGADPRCSDLAPVIECKIVDDDPTTLANGEGIRCVTKPNQKPCAEMVIYGGLPMLNKDAWKKIRSRPNLLARFIGHLKSHVDTYLCPMYTDRVCDSRITVEALTSINYRRFQKSISAAVDLADAGLPYRNTAEWLEEELDMEGFHRFQYPWVFLDPFLADNPCMPWHGVANSAKARAKCALWWYLRGGREWWHGSEMTLETQCSRPLHGHDGGTRGAWWEWLFPPFNDAESISDVIAAEYWINRAGYLEDNATKEHLDYELLADFGFWERVHAPEEAGGFRRRYDD